MLKTIVVFNCFFEPPKVDFWSDLGPQDGPKLGPKWDQNRSKTGPGSEIGSGTDLGSILGRFVVEEIGSGADFFLFWIDFW